MCLDHADWAWLDEEISLLREVAYPEFLVKAGYITAAQRDAHVPADAVIEVAQAHPAALHQPTLSPEEEDEDDKVVAEVDRILNLGEHPVLTKEQAKQARGEFRGRRYLTPAFLAAVLDSEVAKFRDVRYGAGPAPNVTCIKLAVAACAYGAYSTAGAPAPDALDQIAGVAEFQANSDRRALEEVVRYGGLLRPGPSDWEHRWSLARETLFGLVRQLISPAVRWIGRNVLVLHGDDLKQWTRIEAAKCAAQIRDALIHRCDCWTRWADFRIESESLAREHCKKHALSAWPDPQQVDKGLSDVLFQAVVTGALNSREANVNDFRRGMLAKCVVDETLVAGQTLKCTEELGRQNGKMQRCLGEIRLDDRCDRCGGARGVKDITWWLWWKGDRLVWHCRRCMGCDRLFFQHPGQCPLCPTACPVCEKKDWVPRSPAGEVASGVGSKCVKVRWSPRDTVVWIPVANAPPGALQTVPATTPPPFQDLLDEESRRELENAIRRLPEPEQSIAGRILLEGWTEDSAAEEQGDTSTSPKFKKRIRSIRSTLARFLGEPNEPPPSGLGAGQPMLETKAGQQLCALLDSLPDPEPQIARRLLQGGSTFDEVAKLLEVAPTSVEFMSWITEITKQLEDGSAAKETPADLAEWINAQLDRFQRFLHDPSDFS